MHSTREGVRTDKTCQLAPRHSPDPQRPTTGRFPPSRRQHRGGGEPATPDGHIRTARRQMTASVSISNATPTASPSTSPPNTCSCTATTSASSTPPPASAPSATPPPPDRSSWPSSKPPPTRLRPVHPGHLRPLPDHHQLGRIRKRCHRHPRTPWSQHPHRHRRLHLPRLHTTPHSPPEISSETCRPASPSPSPRHRTASHHPIRTGTSGTGNGPLTDTCALTVPVVRRAALPAIPGRSPIGD